MAQPGTPDNPLRVAIIGAGPAGFFAAEHLLKKAELSVQVDLYDRLPTPHGLVRAGVAPDHEKIKKVSARFEKTAQLDGFRFFGHVDIGKSVSVPELQRYYHQILFTTGAQVDRHLDIPGEDLPRSYSATEFVAWYNGHPDYCNHEFDLSVESVVIIGVGNVAVDVARILCRTTDELYKTDIADYALDALADSNIRQVHMLGRRGPAQAAFTNPEVKELGELPGADLIIDPADLDLDEISRAYLEENPDRLTEKKLSILSDAAQTGSTGKSRQLFIHFLTSPVSFEGEAGVEKVFTVRNELYLADSGRIRPRAVPGQHSIDAGAVFRSVGYRGVAIPRVPFRDDWGTIPHRCGRIMSAPDGDTVPGLYAAGWIKRGPTGVIGTNKADAIETAVCMIEDAKSGTTLSPESTDPATVEQFIRERSDMFSFADWRRVDDLETARGEEQGRPRRKFTSYEELVQARKRDKG